MEKKLEKFLTKLNKEKAIAMKYWKKCKKTNNPSIDYYKGKIVAFSLCITKIEEFCVSDGK